MDTRIAIIGGGPGGLMLARLLQLRAVDVVVFERDAHEHDRPQGGSLDLHAETGQRAMRLAGLATELSAAARPEDQGDRLYDPTGALLYDRDGIGDDRPEVDRGALRSILLASLEPGTVRWNSRVRAVVPRDDGADVDLGDVVERFGFVVGADGAGSRVRAALSTAAPIYEGITLVEFDVDAMRHPQVHPHVAALVGNGKMFAVGDNRVLVGQRNGGGRIRVYAGVRMSEAESKVWQGADVETVRRELHRTFDGWAPALLRMIEGGDFIAVRPIASLPPGLRWPSHARLTLLGDAAHLMSPFSGEGVNLALADAVDLAEALTTRAQDPHAISNYEATMAARTEPTARGAVAAGRAIFSSTGAQPVLEHYRERTGD